MAVLQEANSGNIQNAGGATQSDSEADDIKPGGTDISITSQLVQDCRQLDLYTPQDRFDAYKETSG